MDRLAKWKDKRIWIIGTAVLVLISIIVFSLFFGGLSEPEQVALDFYKKAWIQNDLQAAKELMKSEPSPASRYWAGLMKSTPRKNGPVLLLSEEGPAGKAWEVYIHRPDLDEGFRVTVEDVNGQWKITKYVHDKPSEYDTIYRANPHLRDQWKEIENP